ncbi:LysR family transcriptional regulator [Rhizobium leguminosarum]|uniref:LysR family transcriptional regulator n=1 Tax=Rhizobium leguminosarum TaxID=384 RepID=A0ABD7PSG8_RHILE|nr:LysR substrate-binding domain-containing protein [Rhizobium leguminosarum]TAV74113.1 LysR family transcriptional regulator [Rhizobium leguminosarum]TAV78713.1 LysR family transcriptional regulator [Rhizobium leguminosarum]TAW30126.1 LysR family transcriptional regulator [Rhizobium leguminosarum]TAW43854.1 LysR family transcriptional regulator [Rhizobium leguminosarum]TAZ30521.1 LysR family transcriptional regulator [Rhizobium leguminosarum]
MDFFRLRTLRELSRRETMAAVADALGISSSAVSQQIAQLEDEVGIALVERRGRGVTLTLAGRRLVVHADRIFAVVEEAKTDIAELQNIVAGDLRIAAQPSAASSFIPAAMRQLATDHPHLDIVMTTMGPAEGVAALRAWQADIVIADDISFDPHTLEGTADTLFLCRDQLFVLLPAGHSLESEPVIELAQLRDGALDVASSAYCRAIRQACLDIGFEPAINGFSDSFEVVFALVEAGCSISVMPGLALRDFGESLTVKPLTPSTYRSIYAISRRGEARNPKIAAVLDQLVRSAPRDLNRS